MIPIIIVCFNNYKYVDNTINQIRKINNDYVKNIKIMDNNSYCLKTIEYLKNIDVEVIFNKKNNGPWISKKTNRNIYNILPDKFILTDPDLQFNDNLPKNFIEILEMLSDKYKKYKVGFAIDISEPEKMFQGIFHVGHSICDWESQFWMDKIENNDLQLYNAEIDTTFSLINKKYQISINEFKNCMRVAGNFTCKHLPWYIDNPIFSIHCNYQSLIKSKYSTSSNLVLKYINDNFLIIKKNNQEILIKNDASDKNLNFWKDIYGNWEKDTFETFDKYLDENKIFIDIGAWIGTTCIYANRKSKYTYAIEADVESFQYLHP